MLKHHQLDSVHFNGANWQSDEFLTNHNGAFEASTEQRHGAVQFIFSLHGNRVEIKAAA